MSPRTKQLCPTCGGGDDRRSRALENVGFLVGLVVAVLYTQGVKLGPAEPPAWAVVSVLFTCIAPKMLGRATSGRIWGKWFGGGSGAAGG